MLFAVVIYYLYLQDNIVTSIVKDIMEQLPDDASDSSGNLETKCSTAGVGSDGMTKVIEEYKSVFGEQKIQ